jgi:hypothetical protein
MPEPPYSCWLPDSIVEFGSIECPRQTFFLAVVAGSFPEPRAPSTISPPISPSVISGWPVTRPLIGSQKMARRVPNLAITSHLRELVTIIEMQAGGNGTPPLCREKSRVLRDALKATLEAFAAKEADSQSWLETIKKRIDNINSHDAKTKVKNIIAQLPS